MEKIFNHPQIGSVTLRKKLGNRAIRISVHPRRGVVVTMPWYVSYTRAEAFLEEKKFWVIETLQKQKKRIGEIAGNGKSIPSPAGKKEIESLRRKARNELVPQLYTFAVGNGFTDADGMPLYKRVAIKNNVSNWGSCSGKNNINLNMRLMMVPPELQRYVLLHELCHLKHHDHSPAFHQLLNTLCDGREKELSHELREYRLV